MDKANHCIHCTVNECEYHCSDKNYCTLDTVRIGSHESSPTTEQCTDCLSFRPAQG